MFASIEFTPHFACASPLPPQMTGTFGVAVPAAAIWPMISARCVVAPVFACELSSSNSAPGRR
ncbi:hypothetical protein [Burkholderia vietnamiensis]|uniref:hypothetical protein n=1 Tax=Burkholderia vietnamiensis TaxID=60552 RepID=UPI001CF24062|nr:hypothetical protein [Burkholderia vietnamiensis]